MTLASIKDGRRLTGYTNNSSSNMEHVQHHSNNIDDDDDDIYEEYNEDSDHDPITISTMHSNNDDDDGEDDTGSELSIPDPNIDFDMVYALHTFAATVEGQASVVRGDALTLLDDTNSYWWLIKILKTSEIGYIPAENIETPYERLARLNSHRNIELTRRDIQDAFPTPPSTMMTKRRATTTNKKRVTLARGVQFQSQIIYESSDDDEDNDNFQAEFEQWHERMRSDDSDEEQDSDDDPYDYYNHATPAAVATASFSNDPTDYYRFSTTTTDDNSSDEDEDNNKSNHLVMSKEEQETIKISLTPSIARDYHDNPRQSDNSIQSKLKKAAKLDALLGGHNTSNGDIMDDDDMTDSQQTAAKRKSSSGLRKFFSRSKKSSGERRGSSSSNLETVSISSQSTTGMTVAAAATTSTVAAPSSLLSLEPDRPLSMSSSDSLSMDGGATNALSSTQRLSIYIDSSSSQQQVQMVQVDDSTTALELIQQIVTVQQQQQQDYYLMVRTLGGDEYTLVPSDRPLEIFHSLTTHLNTPMPSLKKARRISQLMSSVNHETHMGGPSNNDARVKDDDDEEEATVRFFLCSRTRRAEEGEIQMKVSLMPSSERPQRTDKLVRVPARMTVRDAIPFLLAKFHVLNGVVADEDVQSLRLDWNDTVVEYGLAMNRRDGQVVMVDVEEKVLNVFGDQVPSILYRRHSNPDRASLTVNITPPEKHEIYFILTPLQHRQQSTRAIQQEHVKEEEEQQQQQKPEPPQRRHRLVRQDTPMPPRHDISTLSDAAATPFSITPQQYQPQIVLDDDDTTIAQINGSPEEAMLDSHLDSSRLMSQLDEAIDTLQSKPRPESTESLLPCHDFGMNELMVIIRGAAAVANTVATSKRVSYRNEVIKDSQARLDQLEKELDRIMNEAVNVYH